jgi:hypothetical protein
LSGIGKGFPLRKICDSWGLGLIRTEGMPYSNDLRLRVLAAVDGGVPVRQVAALLRVSVSYIYKALNLLFGLGSISMAGSSRPLHGRRISAGSLRSPGIRRIRSHSDLDGRRPE